MPEIEIHASQWRLVEVGRVVIFVAGPYAGRLGVILEIIDHKRVSLVKSRVLSDLWPLHPESAAPVGLV